MIRLGIDLGGTKTEIVALDDAGVERLRRRVETPRDDYEAVIETIVQLVAETEAELGAGGTVGVGTPGAISPATGLLKNSNSTALNGRPLATDLERALGRAIRMTNDANCFALSEAADGAAAGAEIVFGVIIGTGTGGGLVVRGRVLTGVNAIAGEWGHNPLPWPDDDERPGPHCYCGRRGCIETFLSGPGMMHDHALVTAEHLEPAEIVERAQAGEPDCRATLERYENRMARALAHVINIVDPDVVVLGGGMGNIARLYDNVPRMWGGWVFSDRVDTGLAPPLHGDSSGVRGAARLWD
ncbi:MAG: ROK family protein [Gammaproteobacteria bacterium]|nr:ROK family protein [Gammaproteobacteria bacterium]